MTEIRKQIERETFARARQRDGTHAQRDHDDEQCRHHELRHALDAFLDAQRAHDDAHGNRDEHPRHHLGRVRHHRAECRGRRIRNCTVEHARRHLGNVREHPAADGRVKHEQQHRTDVAPPSEPSEILLRGQHVERAGGRSLARTTYGELHHHDRQSQHDQEDEVQDNERRTAILAGDVGKTPDVAKADGATGGHENEPDARLEMLACLFCHDTLLRTTDKRTEFIRAPPPVLPHFGAFA